MTRPSRYPQELRERAVRLVFEHQDEHASQWAAICSIADKFGVSSETLRKWVRRAETDKGLRPGLTSDERQRLKTLEREVRELRRANEILKSAAAFFGAELDRRPSNAEIAPRDSARADVRSHSTQLTPPRGPAAGRPKPVGSRFHPNGRMAGG